MWEMLVVANICGKDSAAVYEVGKAQNKSVTSGHLLKGDTDESFVYMFLCYLFNDALLNRVYRVIMAQ
jgi:hypothetical protein